MSLKPLIRSKINDEILATVRAITGNETLQIDFDKNLQNNFFHWNQDLSASDKLLRIAEIEISSNNLTEDSQIIQQYINDLRANSDLASCYNLFFEKKVFKKVLQENNIDIQQQKFFEEFEKIRVTVLAHKSLRGVTKNILNKIEQDVTELLPPTTAQGLSLAFLQELLPAEILQNSQETADIFKNSLSKKLQKKLSKLSQNISDQEAFLEDLSIFLQEKYDEENSKKEREESEPKSNSIDNNPEENTKNGEDLNNFGNENVEQDKQDADNDSKQEEQETSKESQSLEEKIQQIESSNNRGKSINNNIENSDRIEFKPGYRVFTNKFDEVIFPQKLVSRSELELLRDQLDIKLSQLNKISQKITLNLKKKLLSKRNAFLDYDSSRGILNRKKFVNFIINPEIEDIWINNHEHEYQDTAITILLDNSGSMRGKPIVMSALACEIIAEILEKFSIKTEIIGFTTADWKGGRARKLWENNGKPKNPGRLNELRHIVYKQFSQSFKKSRINLGLMLKEGILKENIDGEAILFAYSRLIAQKERRKILMVISDGTPIDDSTVSANDDEILSEHLHHVINKIENNRNFNKKVEIVGVGIGHTTSDFYRNSIMIRNIEDLGDSMINKISELL